jgi:hypothetical protein
VLIFLVLPACFFDSHKNIRDADQAYQGAAFIGNGQVVDVVSPSP